MKYCFGVDVGGTTVKIALLNTQGEILDKWEIPSKTENDGEAILPDIIASLKTKIAEKNLEMDEIIGIGMGVPTTVSDDGIVTWSANLGWKYKEVKREMEEGLGLPVVIGNDANVAALGELWLGGGKGHKNLVMITLGTGVGGGIINQGKIVNGSNGAGGEIGHITVNYEETASCGCGRQGCLEQYASATGLVRLAKQHLEKDTRKSVLREEEVSAKTIFDGVKAGDEVACEIAEEFARYLGYALVNIACVVDPEVFVIGGGVSKAGQVLIEYIEKYYQERTLKSTADVKFALATLGNDAGVCGAAKMLL